MREEIREKAKQMSMSRLLAAVEQLDPEDLEVLIPMAEELASKKRLFEKALKNLPEEQAERERDLMLSWSNPMTPS